MCFTLRAVCVVVYKIVRRLKDGMQYQLLNEYNRTAQNDNKTSPETLQLTRAWDQLQTQVCIHTANEASPAHVFSVFHDNSRNVVSFAVIIFNVQQNSHFRTVSRERAVNETEYQVKL